MKIFKLIIITGLINLLSQSAFANTQTNLLTKRTNVIHHYVSYLGQGHYQKIIPLFSKHGQAISSSGKTATPLTFYKTLLTKTIHSPHSSLINTFSGKLNHNMMAALFQFSWINQKGQRVSSRFLDLIVFMPGSTKIKQLFVYSNTFKADIMKQLG